VTLSHNGYIKRLSLKTYRSQHRGGKGVSGGSTRENDFVEHFFVASTHDYLLCFTNLGRLYWLRVFDIPEMSRTAAGRYIAQVLSLREEEKITSVIPVRSFEGDCHLLMATQRGLVKKTALSAYSRPKQGGIIGINLDKNDTLIGVVLTQAGDEVVLCTRKGMAIRFDEGQVRAMGRNTRGVKGINLQGDDEVIGLVVADPEGFLLTICANGYGKRTPFGANAVGDSEPEGAEEADVAEPVQAAEPSEAEPESAEEEEDGRESSSMHYRRQRRGGKGLIDIKTTARNGPVVGVVSVRENDDIMLITVNGMVNRTHVSEIRVIGRNTQGVRVMNLNNGDQIASVASVAHEEDAVSAPVEAE
jgi:DNA gyrase subunit A